MSIMRRLAVVALILPLLLVVAGTAGVCHAASATVSCCCDQAPGSACGMSACPATGETPLGPVATENLGATDHLTLAAAWHPLPAPIVALDMPWFFSASRAQPARYLLNCAFRL